MIEFTFDENGKMCMKVEHLVHTMTLATYRKWLKLFIRYGTPEQKSLLIEELTKARADLIPDIEKEENKIARYEMLNSIYNACALRKSKSKYNGLMKRYNALGKKLDLIRRDV